MDIKKIIAQKELEAIGGTPKVYCYNNEEGNKSVDILSCMDRPFKDIVSYGTIGLSDYDIGKTSDDKKLRIELLGACDIGEELFPNIISSAVFDIMERENCGYGHIILNVVSEYYNNCEMKHLYLMNPFFWEDMKTIEFDDRKVTWLLIVPISESEKEYAITNGYDALETKFEEADIDIFDLKRKSVI